MLIKVLLALCPMVLALPMAMDVYIPAVAHMETALHATDQQMMHTLNLFMLSAGLMQLIIGPISDQTGRRRASVASILIFIFSTLACGLSQDVHQLIVFRILQAIGCCGMMVIAFAVVRDLFEGRACAKVYSFLNSIISFSPIFATFIGSLLDLYFGWQWTFWLLLIVTLPALFTMGIWLQETLPVKDRNRLSPDLIKNYAHVLSNREFNLFNFTSAIGHLYLYLFCSMSPFILLKELHIPLQHYGFYFCFMGISLLIGSITSGLIVERVGVHKTCQYGFLLTLAGGITMLLDFHLFGLRAVNFVLPMLLIGCGGTFCMGAGNGGAMRPFDQHKGVAAAALGASKFLFAGIVGAFVLHHGVVNTLPLAIPAVILSILGLALLPMVEQHREPVGLL